MFRLPADFETLLADRTHGSSVLVGAVAQTLAQRRDDLTRSEFIRLAAALLERRPEFALLHHLLHHTGLACFGAAPTSGLRVRQAAAGWLEAWRHARLNIELPAAAPGVQLRLLTWSHSGTVFEWIKRLHSRHPRVHVLCARSLPGGEGECMAAQLSAVNVSAETLEDLAARDSVAGCTWVVVGADALQPTRFWNKVGTCRLLRQAAGSGRPVMVVAESSKWCHPSWGVRPQASPAGGNVFEPTDNQLVTFFVTERGTWPPQRLGLQLETPPLFAPLAVG